MCKCWDDSCITHYISRPGSVAVAGVGGSRQQQCGAESCSVVRVMSAQTSGEGDLAAASW